MPQFRVIRASAGSGKTFSLTREYLRLLITGQDVFRHILAVTFTNKATEEMKSRILLELHLLSSGKPSRQLEGLIRATGLLEMEIREKSKTILKQLLHKYSWFSVTTIDSFFQRIIRNFTRELGIQEGYIIELDTEPVLNDIIDNLLVNAEHDKSLLGWLTLFAESLIEKGENWNLKRSMQELGREIFSEEFRGLDEESMVLLSDRSFMNEYRDTLYSIRKKIENQYKSFGTRGIEILKSRGLTVEDFRGKSKSPADFFVRLADGSFREPGDTIKSAAFDREKWYTRTTLLKDIIAQAAENELMPLAQEALTYYNENKNQRNTASAILKNLFTLGILTDLSRLSDIWCSENNTFLLPEAPVFLNRIIDGNDTPFIYEKAGFWFHHFMIDEFQDTSAMQWNNFKPLISNSLSQNFDNLAVGDIKQSIYRWRNSNWDILENQIHRDFLPGIIDPVTLAQNRRSRENIVGFNNFFFSGAAESLQEEFQTLLIKGNVSGDFGTQPITSLYRDMKQEAARENNSGGHVNVRFIGKENDTDFYETVNAEVVRIIYEILDKGYQQKDIAILTRKNSEAALLAEFLLKSDPGVRKPIKVISDEALRLGSSVLICSIMALLRYMADPSDKNNNYYLSAVFSNYIHNGKEDEPWINTGLSADLSGMPDEFFELASGSRSYSLVEIVERITRIFCLDSYEGELVYLMAFRDMILEYCRNHNSDLSRFIEFWDETGINKSVAAPSGQDAVRILTLHKSKGLEFKITIMPYCTWELITHNKSFLWCRPSEEPFNRLPLIPVIFTKQLADTLFDENYYREVHHQLVDNLNLLYVAFTRARDAMYIFCKDPGNNGMTTVSALASKILGNNDFVSGSLPDPELKEPQNNELIHYKPIHSETLTRRLRIAFQGNLIFDPAVNKPSRPVNEGRILHEIFMLIHTRDDIKTAVASLHLQGKIAEIEKDRYIRLIEYAMNDLQVSTWFTSDWNILAEAEIIVPGGEIRRPDRVMTKNAQTLIIDYKFGNKTGTLYESQVREYASLLSTMGYKGVEAYLWYVRLGKVVQVRM